jgi:hypothetical protein
MARGYRSRLDRECRRAAPPQHRALESVRRESGIGDAMWARWVAGDATPVGWLQRRIAEALQVDVETLWPSKSARPDERPRAPWRRVA